MTIIKQTQLWLENVVIGLNLCPFAKKPYQTNKIRYALFESDKLEDLILQFIEELRFLEHTPPSEIDTTLLIIEKGFNEFGEFWDFASLLENIIDEMGYRGIFQIATFHPRYQFEGTQVDDNENYTNRSPYPMIHILRESSMEKALENYPNPELIPAKNIATLQQLSKAHLRKLVRGEK